MAVLVVGDLYRELNKRVDYGSVLGGARRGGGVVGNIEFWPRQQAMMILALPTSDGNVCS